MINFSEIIYMHGYGIYIWPCYLISGLLIGYNFFKPILIHRKYKKLLKENK